MTELVRVCEVLGVSESYLLGISNELERDPSATLRHACLRGVRNMLGQVAELTLDGIERHAKLVGLHAQHERTLLRSGESLLEALFVVDRLNTKKLDDIPGWATVLRVKDNFEVALEDARRRITTHDRHDSNLRKRWSAVRDAEQADMDDES
jgi:hypothetical protein